MFLFWLFTPGRTIMVVAIVYSPLSSDLGAAIPFLVRQTAVEDEADLVQFVSSFRLEQSFEFKSVGLTTDIDHTVKLYPSGLHVVVSTEDLNTLLSHFRFFTADQMLHICSAHGIKFSLSSQKIPKTKILNVMLTHECGDKCRKLKYVFKMLRVNR